eukprot:CAMPEP_0117685092 /NCGR_PEP_ID=MMETSP0804-20121206/21530_1 /TAXON_ID=1074897 /ORGANISM="Tetraselmis astigmatica, Strain CCMP880" /LENGTH=71 /DNA_ID=CAMNT_0005496291 /DNA_START=36 /DNA_END=251 /DNA_ORIENTATION=+
MAELANATTDACTTSPAGTSQSKQSSDEYDPKPFSYVMIKLPDAFAAVPPDAASVNGGSHHTEHLTDDSVG